MDLVFLLPIKFFFLHFTQGRIMPRESFVEAVLSTLAIALFVLV